MQTPGVSITDMFMRVRAEVMKQTGSKQVPWEASSLVGSFYFTGAPNDAAPAIGSSRIDPTAFELSYWDTIKNSTNADDFKAYLEKYPNGQFAALAKNRISTLDANSKTKESRPDSSDAAVEVAFWDTIKNSKDPEDFKDYLTRYPKGQFAGVAQRRLGALANVVRTENLPSSGTSDASKSTNAPAKPLQNQYGIELVYIPPGEFIMGADNDETNERPAHRVTISNAFYIGRYEVTQAQWQAVMGKNPSYFKDNDKLPVEMVSWKDAQDFIARLNALNDNYVYRLPTEAEWEYACRGGTTTAFAFGDSLSSEQANFDGHFPFGGATKGPYWEKTAPVGRYQPNAFGLYDMHGNVWEWVEDWYSRDYYKASPVKDPTGPATGGQKVVRGGEWYDKAHSLRSSNRESFSSGDRSMGIGLRVVAVLRTH
jgi:formylglycine-generating enzyme required for sulfatase activity